MEISLELFITVSLSFMFTFVFGKLVSMAATIEDRVISASEMKPDPEPEAGLESLVDSIERNSFDEQCLEEKEDREEDEEIEVARFQRIPDLDRAEFAAEESNRSVEFHREVIVSDSDCEHLLDEFLEKRGFSRRICEIGIELMENMSVETNGEILEEEDEENEIGDWVEIERKDLEMFGRDDAVAGDTN